MSDHAQYSPIAIISMAAKFPGANSLDEYWRNIIAGVESIRKITRNDLISEEVDPNILAQDNYVNAKGVLDDIDMFDAEFFGFSPREAEILDPQQRIFLELAWQALEQAGCVAGTLQKKVGVFAGASHSTYFLNNLLNSESLLRTIGRFEMMLSNNIDYLPTRTSYKLNLQGPSIAVQTACSTSLVAVHVACKSLHNHECDIALAGAISVVVPQKVGYLYREGGIASPDGHCRAFDEQAKGTVGGSGGGVVILKRLDEALASGDYIHAVILGSAVNNDGSSKVGFTAPSVTAQASAIRLTHQRAGVDPGTIGYVEGHGSGTPLGDPIELAALTDAFRMGTEKTQFCGIGSVKSNVGHLDAASGIAGLIKAVLAVEHGLIPKTLHYKRPNPLLDISNTPFYIAEETKPWPPDLPSRRAGISSFGIGGTNAHVLIQQPPNLPTAEPSDRPFSLLLFSARTEAALVNTMNSAAEYLDCTPSASLADVAYTLQTGRRRFKHRSAFICGDFHEVLDIIRGKADSRFLSSVEQSQERRFAFMFPGLGEHYPGMAKGLYHTESVFRDEVNRLLQLGQPHYDYDLLDAIFPKNEGPLNVSSFKNKPLPPQDSIFASLVQRRTRGDLQSAPTFPSEVVHLFTFCVEYATAKLLQSWGIHPAVLIGHSLGEYSAATLAEVMSLETAVLLLCKRSALLRRLGAGLMLSVSLATDELTPQLAGHSVTLAADNSPANCVVAGGKEAIQELQSQLNLAGIACQLLPVTVAYHSPHLDDIINEYRTIVETQELKPPMIPFISNLSGTWITGEEAISPEYWAAQMRNPVLFRQGVQRLRNEGDLILVEVGPSQSLTSFASQSSTELISDDQVIVPTIRHRDQPISDSAFILKTLGRIWLAGGIIDWQAFHRGEARRIVPLPTYPFERRRFWASSSRRISRDEDVDICDRTSNVEGIADLFSVPSWTRSSFAAYRRHTREPPPRNLGAFLEFWTTRGRATSSPQP